MHRLLFYYFVEVAFSVWYNVADKFKFSEMII